MKRRTLLLLMALGLPGPAMAQSAIDTLLVVESGARLEVDAFVGDVRVETWDQDRVRIRTPERRGVEIDGRGSVIRIESEPPRGGRSELWFDITVPDQMDISIEALNGDITVHGTQGRVEAESVNGEVDVTGGRTLVDLSSVKGAVRLSGARGKVQAMSVNSSISIDDVVGDIEAETVNGPIEITGVDTRQLEASSVNGEIRYAGTIYADGWYQMESHNGAIRVSVPGGVGATVTARTYNGDLLTGFPVEVREMGPGKQVTFTVGAGGARIELETFNGVIEINADS